MSDGPASGANPKGMIFVSVMMYLASLGFSDFCTNHGCDWKGMTLLTQGPPRLLEYRQLGVLATLAWFAHPCTWLSWIFGVFRNRAVAQGFALVAVLLGVGFLLGSHVDLSDGNWSGPVIRHGPGYWLWLASLLMAFVAASQISTRR